MRRPWLPLRPRRDDSCAVGARRGARSRRRIKRLLSPPIAPRLTVLKRGAARRAECDVVRHDRRMAHSALLLLLFNTTRTTSGPPSTGAAIAMDGGVAGTQPAITQAVSRRRF